jgi:hypothetical protein
MIEIVLWIVLWIVGVSFSIFVGLLIMGQPEEAEEMPMMTNGTNGIYKDESKQDTIHVVTLSSSEKLYEALTQTRQRFAWRDGHLDNCVDVHCHTHGIFFPAYKTKGFCLTSHYLVFPEWPRTIMCRICADIVIAVMAVKPPFENWLFH